MADQLYRKKVMDRLSSPEQLNDYLHITRPAVWVVIAAILLLIIGGIIWSSVTYINSVVNGTAEVNGGHMTVTFDDDQFAQNVQAGLDVTVGDTKSTILSVGWNPDGSLFATADTSLTDGTYPASVSYRRTQILQLLFN